MDYTIRQSWAKRVRPEPVYPDWEELTEQAYIPVKDQVRRFRAAGLNYQAFKGNIFDFQFDEDGKINIDLDAPIPTRAPNFDLADAMEIQQKAKANVDAAVALDKALKAKAKTAEEPAAPVENPVDNDKETD